MTDSGPRPWRSVLEGPTAHDATRLAQELANAFASHQMDGARLNDGAASAALLLAYASEALDDDALGTRAEEFLERAAAHTAAGPPGIGLFTGITGPAWVIQHLVQPADDQDDPNSALDAALLRTLDRPATALAIDHLEGLAGIAAYGLERLPRSSAVQLLQQVVARLDRTARHEPDGTTWLTPPSLLSEHERTLAPHGYMNLGVARGVPGVIAVLARIVAAGIEVRRARVLLDGAVTWLLAQESRDTAGPHFGCWKMPDDATPPAPRTAWCYGDPGIGATLLGAARAVGEPAWEERAIELLRSVADRDPDACDITDACLCHGTFGLAHIFARAYHATGLERFAGAARDWARRGLDQRTGRPVLAAFEFTLPTGGVGPSLELLKGSCGVGLALLGLATDLEPAWDRLLLIDVPEPANHAPQPATTVG